MDNFPDKKTIGDALHKALKTGFGSMPEYGAPLAALFDTIFTAPIEKRKQEWFKHLGEVITEIQNKIDDISPEKLSKNEIFINTALRASQIALRTHREEKIKILKNAIFNSASTNAPAEDIQAIFLNYIDEFTPWHIRLLLLFNDPIKYMEKNNIKNPGWSIGGISAVITHCFPELINKKEFYTLLFRYLQSAGFILQGQIIGTTMSGSGMVQSQTTPFGKDFIKYISK